MANEIKIRIESTPVVTKPVQLNTVNYGALSGKPKINGVELVGDKSTADLGIEVDTTKFATKDELNNKANKSDIPDTSEFATKEDLAGKADTTAVPTKTSQLTNDSGFITGIPSEYVTETELTNKGYLTEHQDISGKADKSDIPDVSGFATKDDVDAKQDKLTAGDGITIDGTTISATGGGGASLPDQTGNAGKLLITDGTTASWGGGIISTRVVSLGYNASTAGALYVAALGGNVSFGATSYGATIIGHGAGVGGTYATAIGCGAVAGAKCAIQLGSSGNYFAPYTNSDANTFKVGNENGNFEMMDANGNIPLERLTYVTDQIGDISTALTAILGE